MQIKFKNSDLQGIYQFLNNLKIKGAAVNRARYQVVKLFEIKLQELSKDRQNLIEMYAEKDSSGELIVKNDQYQMSSQKKSEYAQEVVQLMTEDALITIDDYRNKVVALYNLLTKYDEELTGTDGYAYGAFLDELERIGINK